MISRVGTQMRKHTRATTQDCAAINAVGLTAVRSSPGRAFADRTTSDATTLPPFVRTSTQKGGYLFLEDLLQSATSKEDKESIGHQGLSMEIPVQILSSDDEWPYK